MAKEQGEVVAVVREWNPQHETSLANIHARIDAMGRRAGEAAVRDYAEVEAAVDKLTKRVKTRKVTVHETVTEYVDAEDAPTLVETPPEPGEEPKKKLGWFARRKAKGSEAEPAAEAPALVPDLVFATPPTPVTARATANDAWDPGEGRAIEAPKPLQSKAAKRTAAKKPAKKKR